MASIIVSIDVDDKFVESIKEELRWQKEDRHIPDGTGWFNPDGRIAIDNAMLHNDPYDDSFFAFDFIKVVESEPKPYIQGLYKGDE
jgi:hypothetical protein